MLARYFKCSLSLSKQKDSYVSSLFWCVDFRNSCYSFVLAILQLFTIKSDMLWYLHGSNSNDYPKWTKTKKHHFLCHSSFLKKNLLEASERTLISLVVSVVNMHVHTHTVCASLNRQMCPYPIVCANASLWLWINNSEYWHSRVEPLLFMVGDGTNRWLH